MYRIHDVYRLFLVTLNFQYSVECSNVQVDILLLMKTIFKLSLIFSFIVLLFFLKGTLKGFDQTINLILDESHERVFSTTQGVEQVILGLYIIRGDNVYVHLLKE